MAHDSVEELAAGTRFGKFLSVGAAGAVVDVSVSSVLTLAAILPPQWAKLVGAEIAIVLMFLVNDHWTFPEEGALGLVPKLRRLLKSNLVRTAGLAVQFAVVAFLTGLDVQVVVLDTDIWDVVTLPIAIAFSFVINYVAESLITWRVTAS
ncbi:GtrA family protein [Haloparvum sp. PAK95]|uniref:GtrA family protein n=1 Tax=Haloparvum sp. PAK95 TaxID=3418962 RepID=UPI003D2EEC61